jgi:hypothetical protein
LSIFFELPYWEDLKINHLLDPMHIFKNVATTVWEHMMGVRDSLAIRMDLQCCGKMPSAWPVERKNGQVILPRAPWTLTRSEMRDVKEMITTIRTPTGYMRCLRGAFSKQRRKGVEQLAGLKSHDWHKMLQVRNWIASY